MFHIILTNYRGIFRLVRLSLHNLYTGWVVRCTCWVVSNPMHIMMQIVLDLDTLYHVCLLRPCPANPYSGMTPTMSRQSFFYYDTDYAPLILHPFSAFLKAGLQTSSLNIRGRPLMIGEGGKYRTFNCFM